MINAVIDKFLGKGIRTMLEGPDLFMVKIQQFFKVEFNGDLFTAASASVDHRIKTCFHRPFRLYP